MSAKTRAAGDLGEKGVAIFVLIDALGWKLAQTHEFLSDLLPFRYPAETVLGFSSAAIPTILSGEMPEVHGHWCLFKKGGVFSCFAWTLPLGILPGRLRENYRTRNLVSAITRTMFGISGYFCLYEIPVSMLHRLDYVERKNLWAPGALRGCPSIFDVLKAHSVSYYSSGWKRSDEWRTAGSENALSGEPIRCCFVYLSELDAALHVFGLDSAEARSALSAAGVRVRKLIAEAEKHYSSVELFVFSDHGMTPVIECHDLESFLTSSRRDASDSEVFLDSTMARFWPKSEGAKKRLEETLATLKYGSVLSAGQREELGLRFKTKEYGEVTFVMNSGHLIVPSYTGTTPLKAMHGFHPSDEYSDACFLSSRELDPHPGHIRDFFSIFLTRLGLAGAGLGHGPGRMQEEK